MVGFYCWFFKDCFEEVVGVEIVRFEGGLNIGSLDIDELNVVIFIIKII